MESIFSYICSHAEHAHLIIFTLIILAGFCIPISEDLMLLLAGGIASTCVPERTVSFYIWIFFACWFSAWIAYWMGRLLGPKLLTLPWFKNILKPSRLKKIKGYFQRFGIFTFIVGRFIPGGVRNAIFLTAGLTKMPFGTFIARDVVACFIASITIFSIGYISGQNIPTILHYFEIYEKLAVLVIALLITFAILFIWLYKKKEVAKSDSNEVN